MLTNSSLSDESPYNSKLRMDVLSNEALFIILDGWRDAVGYVGVDNAAAHPHSKKLMEELLLRGIVDGVGSWLVDPDTADKKVLKFVRVAEKPQANWRNVR